ncbi:hypothetical protein L484_009295 [Morus notabilis]|uniref:Uncharacterized protein n=1 Tax=Morus notabilis TaxID=981085 RepID=W9QYZ0_9ROSA|nr:hypothetical protein L484_009295 [Morus notabilis]
MRLHSFLALLFLTMLVFTELNPVQSKTLRSSTHRGRRLVRRASVSTPVRVKNGRVLASDRVYNKMASGPSGKGTGH